MNSDRIMSQIKLPGTVEEMVALARAGVKMEVRISPRFEQGSLEPGRKHASFKLHGEIEVNVSGEKTRFEKTYAKGHEVAPAAAAANGFVIANTRMQRDVKVLTQAGIKVDYAPFVLARVLPDLDLTGFEPHKPYALEQFGILAGIGEEVKVSMSTFLRTVTEGRRELLELGAQYTIYYEGEQYRIETFHGCYQEGAASKAVERIYEVANQRLDMEQHNLRRVGVEIPMDLRWRRLEEFSSLHLAPAAAGLPIPAGQDHAPLHAVQGK